MTQNVGRSTTLFRINNRWSWRTQLLDPRTETKPLLPIDGNGTAVCHTLQYSCHTTMEQAVPHLQPNNFNLV